MNDNLNNFNELGLIPIPSSIKKLDLDITLNTAIRVIYNDNDKALKKGQSMKSLEDLVKTYIDPYKPTDTKPKTDKQQQKSDQSKAELNKQITDFINSEKVEDIKNNSVSKEEAKNKVNQFFL